MSKPLIALLNAKDGEFGRRAAASRRRMEVLFETAAAMRSLTKGTPPDRLSPRVEREYESHIRSLNRQLKRYRETRYPIFVYEDEEGWAIDHVTLMPGVPRVEVQAISAFEDLSRMGFLERVRQCKHCQKWVFARFPHQSCCSAYCRERFFRSSEHWKAKRREKAKEYYWLHKNKNVK